MENPTQTLMTLERKFWQTMVDNDTDTALEMLEEPSMMVSPQGAMKFDHEGYRRAAEEWSGVLKSFELSDMDVLFPTDSTAVVSYNVKQVSTPRGKRKQTVELMRDTSTWIRRGNHWKCAMHTETPVQQAAPRNS
jgi:hypothetical protein